MTDDTQLAAPDRRDHALTERLATVERAIVLLPAIAAQALIVLALLVPFVTVTSTMRDDQAVSLWQLGLALFGVVPGSESTTTDAAGWLFGIAFLGLFLVALASLIALGVMIRGHVTARGASVLSTIAVLLVIGTLGAWAVIGLGAASESPWRPEPGSLLLLASALLVAVLTFAPTFRSLWLKR